MAWGAGEGKRGGGEGPIVLPKAAAPARAPASSDTSIIFDAVKSMAHRKGDSALLAAFEQTVKYNAQTAEKAAKTRRKNAEARKAEGQAGQGNPG